MCKNSLELIKDLKSIRANHLNSLCRNLFYTWFGDHFQAFNTQESVATNDCYASFKYDYEFVTNYDFDELILPRKYVPTNNLDYMHNLN